MSPDDPRVTTREQEAMSETQPTTEGPPEPAVQESPRESNAGPGHGVTLRKLNAYYRSTHAVKDHHFDAVYAAFIEDEAVRTFMADANPAALRETALRLEEALQRGLWKPRSNSAGAFLRSLCEN